MKHIEETIKLLDHIHRKPETTQRELVAKLDISLGKVNFLINALAGKGLIKLESFKSSKNKKGYLYLLTPKGITEKAEITRKFLKSQMEEYDRLRGEIEELKTRVDGGA
jgi:EPS-associated MarR family transcriptional regulator